MANNQSGKEMLQEVDRADVEMHSIQSLGSPPASNVSMRHTPQQSFTGTPDSKLLSKRLHQDKPYFQSLSACENPKTQASVNAGTVTTQSQDFTDQL